MNAITLRREARLDALNTTEMVSEGALDLARRLSNAADAMPEARLEATRIADAWNSQREARSTAYFQGKRG